MVVNASNIHKDWEWIKNINKNFNADLKAFYYVRVLENPTCRWSSWDALKSGEKPREDIAATIQERAWSSPIWFVPDNKGTIFSNILPDDV